MNQMNEHEWIHNLERLCHLYLQSFPDGSAAHFVKWVHSTYGYVLKVPFKDAD